MMGSNRVVIAQANTLSGVFELVELLKNADSILPEAVAELRTLSKEITAAQENLRKTEQADAGRVAELDRRALEIVASTAMLVTRERDAQAADAANSSRDAELSQRERQLATAQSTIAEDEAALAKQRSDHERQISEANAALDRRTKDTESAILSRLGESAVEIAQAHRAWAEELAALRAAAAADVDTRLAEVIRREAAVAGREASTRKHAAELAALAQE